VKEINGHIINEVPSKEVQQKIINFFMQTSAPRLYKYEQEQKKRAEAK
jgi:hypothetical protein